MFAIAHGFAVALLAASATVRETEAARYAGEWKFASIEYGDMKADGLVVTPDSRLVIRGDAYDDVFTHFVASREEKGTFSVAGGERDHLHVDVRVVERQFNDRGRPPPRNLVRKEVWRLTDAKTFQRCFPNDPAGDRPKTFAQKKGTDTDPGN